MNNNDRFTRLRYALDIKDSDLEKIFAFGGCSVTKETIRSMLKRDQEGNYETPLTNEDFERFLNGLIISQRGQRTESAPMTLELHAGNANNLLLKKVKIALTLTSEDMLAILAEAGVHASKSEISAILRKEGHRNYQVCGDRYARNFLKGLMLQYRNA